MVISVPTGPLGQDQHPPSSAPKLLLITAGLTLVSVAAYVVVGVVRQPKPPPPLVLPSGQTVSFRAATYGTNHHAPIAPWLRLFPPGPRDWVQQRVLKRGPIFHDLKTAPAMLVLWIESTTPPAAGPGSPPPPDGIFVGFVEENGVAAGEQKSQILPAASRYGSTVEFRCFPRRGRRIRVIWLTGDYQKKTVVGEWQIPNPALGSVADWKPEALPITRVNGDLECRLEKAVFRVGSTLSQISEHGGQRIEIAPPRPGEQPRAAFLLNLRSRSGLSNAWTIASVMLADASGNELSPSATSVTATGGKVTYSFSPALWPGETWELRVSAKRGLMGGAALPGPFAPHELLVFTNVSAPAGGGDLVLHEEYEANGVTVRLTGLSLRPPRAPNQGWSTGQASELKTFISGVKDLLSVDLLAATDERGNSYFPVGSSSSSGGAPPMGGSPAPLSVSYSFSTLPLDTKRLTFTFAVQHNREFRFRTKPQIATGEKVKFE